MTSLWALLGLLAGCPAGEHVDHAACPAGERLLGEGRDQSCTSGDASTPDGSAELDAGACSAQSCTGVCDDGACVPCADDGDGDGPDPGCPAEAPQCDEAAEPRTCLCRDALDCTDAAAPRCALGRCEACTDEGDCTHLPGVPRCEAGRCVECTTASEGQDCGEHACDPVDRRCTTTTRASLATCEACLADSECQPGRHCVPALWQGEPRSVAHCVVDHEDETCPRATPVLETRSTRTGVELEVCLPNEALTTCEAVRQMLLGVDCNGDDERCGAPEIDGDGECGPGGFCTVPCGNGAECPTGQGCDGTCQ